MSKSRLKKAIILAFLIRLVFSFIVWHPDVRNHIDWGIRFYDYGASNFYSPDANVWSFTWPNQPPGSIISYAAIRKLFEFTFSILWWVNVHIPVFPSVIVSYFEDTLYPAMLQWPAILADFGIAWLIYKFILMINKSKSAASKARLGAAIFLLNPVIWYNSAFWGQTDATVNFFGMLSFYWLLAGKSGKGIAALVVSLYTKVSLAIFLPIFLILALKKYKIKSLLINSIPTLFALFSITWFFSRSSGKDPLSWLYWLYTNKVLTEQLQVITANAFNIWAALTGIHEQPHSLPFLGLTYQYWSYILFSVFFIPILYLLHKKLNAKNLVIALTLTAFAAWSLLTNMHERYLYPLFPYLTILVVEETKLMPLYWAISGISLVNLWHFWWTPRIEPIVTIISAKDRLLPRILGAVNFLIFIKFYKSLISEK